MQVKKVNSGNNILLKTLFNYIIPFFNDKYYGNYKKETKEKNLESKLKNTRIRKTEFEEILFLEQLILNNIKKFNKKEKLKIKKEKSKEKLDFFEFSLNKKDTDSNTAKEEIKYSLSLINKKEDSEEKGYSVSVRYEENDSEERLDVSTEFDNYGLDKLKKNENEKNNLYHFSIINKKENKNKENYSVKITYEDNYQEERLTINYKSTIGAYLNKRQEALHDFSDRVPGKFVHVFPESIMGGVLGFTYLGENFMGLRADLTGSLKKMVGIHESIHTPDEYETRILTDWIMRKERVRYIK